MTWVYLMKNKESTPFYGEWTYLSLCLKSTLQAYMKVSQRGRVGMVM
jgi:hypothetical protein